MKTIDQIAQFFNESEDFTGSVKQNENLSKHTTMNVGGTARIFLEPENEESLIFAIKALDADVRGDSQIKSFFVLGGGSNVIISDNGLDAVISTRKINSISFFNADKHGCTQICVSAGSSWGSVLSFCKKNNLGGFEAFTGLSGTVGGALFMNATCFGLSACDNLISVRYFDLNDGKIHEYEKVDSDWGYKKSPFQLLTAHCSLLISKVILSAKFSVKNGFDSEKSEKCMSDRREKGHFRAPSSGSAFKNDAAHGIIAGKVIDECGLKGFAVGGAQIAPWHGNFIVNPERKATASDIKKLSDEVKKIVLEKTGIVLENEILFVS
ncbi:UDP-N-acetylmuramate dehydrogenase [uncultured Treponema sp.]|uniref:UDP-N-acetylmuramate dehydrogenase n=1 Tax=uncultured Treponema sp. TaxID=162155 RepID=UPI0025E10974|nr:UDP-N-acetylmuramate dehydrogenase [uncultured Treponema sp.]